MTISLLMNYYFTFASVHLSFTVFVIPSHFWGPHKPMNILCIHPRVLWNQLFWINGMLLKCRVKWVLYGLQVANKQITCACKPFMVRWDFPVWCRICVAVVGESKWEENLCDLSIVCCKYSLVHKWSVWHSKGKRMVYWHYLRVI